MKFITAISFLASLAAAAPTPTPHGLELSAVPVHLEARQGISSNELSNGAAGACPSVIFIFARGSTEPGNMGFLGPSVGSALKTKFGAAKVWVQGVGGAYNAGLVENILPDGSSPAAITEMKNLFTLANTKCPNAKIVAGGYSQGAALAAAAIRDTQSNIRDKIVGTVLFGYTKNRQNNGKIINYPAERTKVFCKAGDQVCNGSLIITADHLNYGSDARGPAPEFLAQRINAVV